MAKEAKSKATKSRAAKTASRKSTTAREKPLRVPMHSVVHFVKMLHDEKHSTKFAKAARKSNAVLTMHPSTVDFVKKYVADNNLHDSMAAKVIDPCPGDPFECHFKD
jgi:hypothetical protein